MCFYVHPGNPNKLIANSDITCWKVVKQTAFKNRVMSKWRDYFYTKGILYQLPELTELKESKQQFYAASATCIDEGFHSYSSLLMAYEMLNRWDCMIVKCTIPAGSSYYYNSEDHEYVSDKIVINLKQYSWWYKLKGLLTFKHV